MKKNLIVYALAIFCSLGSASLYAAGSSPSVELTADTIEYDSTQGVAVAQGGVRIVRDKAVMTGYAARYNANTGETVLSGGVKVVQDQATLTADEVQSLDGNHLTATGDVVLVKEDQRLTGAQLDYYSDKSYALLSGGARLTTSDAVMTAPQLESWISENRAVGTGGIHIVSDTHQVEATADQAAYTSGNAEPGKIVLSGNARAVQQGNTLIGNTLTILLGEKALNAQGRTKLVITPQ